MDVSFIWWSAIPIIIAFIFVLRRRRSAESTNVCVVVLGDVGRSPRMQYHALSFAKEGFNVDLIGYAGSAPLKELQENPRVTIRYLRPPPNLQNTLSRLPSYVLKVVWQSISLFVTLFSGNPSGHLILQNPPAIPTIPICWMYCLLARSRFTIDWHNYAYTIMALNLGKNHMLVKLAKFIEAFVGRQAVSNLCVTRAMKDDLQEKWNIKAETLYDRPPDEFHPISLEEKHSLLLKLSKSYEVLKGEDKNSTAFTECLKNGNIGLREKRPALLVSSTSWTEDEDFSILLNALAEYEEAVDGKNLGLPDLICVITGKGPLKAFYIALISLKDWRYVTVITPWLESEDYPKLLASADLGVCLHTSSSGLDLPMKVVDMFGCGLPVCAYKFQCLHELVRHDENGFVFSDEKELTQQLSTWFQFFPNDLEQQKKQGNFRRELGKFQELRWHGNWSLKVLPLFKK